MAPKKLKPHRPPPARDSGFSSEITTRADGQQVLQLGIDFRHVAKPNLQFVAEAADVHYDARSGFAQVRFGQYKLGTSGELRGVVIVTMGAESVTQFLKTCEEFIPENKSFMDKFGIAPIAIMPIHHEPDSVSLFAANIAKVARASREATADFYHVSAMQIHDLKTGFDLKVEPIVRVHLPVGLLASVLDGLAALADKFPKEAAV